MRRSSGPISDACPSTKGRAMKAAATAKTARMRNSEPRSISFFHGTSHGGHDLTERQIRPDLHLCQSSIPANDVGLWNPPDSEGLRDARPQVGAVGVGDVKAIQVSQSLALGVDIVHTQENHALVLQLLVSHLKFGGFLFTRDAP